jgi:hypothetical protein
MGMPSPLVMHIFWLIFCFLLGYIFRDYRLYKKGEGEDITNDKPKEGEYRPIYIRMDKNNKGGYDAHVYNRHGTHLTNESRDSFIGCLKLIIDNEKDIRSHKFKLLNFDKERNK